MSITEKIDNEMEFEVQLRDCLMDYYSTHRLFMKQKKFKSFIEFRLHNEKFQGPWLNTLHLLIPELEKKRILDVGCGDGGFVTAVAKKKIAVNGCDVSSEHIRMARLRAGKCNIDKDVFIENRDSRLPYKDNSFDVVIMLDVIEHIKNIPPVIDEAHRVLKSGGYFFSSTPNGLWPMEPHVNLPFIHWLPKNIRNPILKKMRGEFAVDLIGGINYLSSSKICNLACPPFSQCFLNDDIFIKKLKMQANHNSDSFRSVVKQIFSKPIIWPWMRHVLRWAWPSIYLLARK